MQKLLLCALLCAFVITRRATAQTMRSEDLTLGEQPGWVVIQKITQEITPDSTREIFYIVIERARADDTTRVDALIAAKKQEIALRKQFADKQSKEVGDETKALDDLEKQVKEKRKGKGKGKGNANGQGGKKEAEAPTPTPVEQPKTPTTKTKKKKKQ